MIVIGVDAHKRSHTACAVGAAIGEPVAEVTVASDEDGHEKMLLWASGVSSERLWAIEDCRHVSGRLERFLIAHGEVAVRVPPKMMANARRSSRTPGKSDAIDARAIALAAIREPDLPRATLPGRDRDVRLLIDYRDQLVRERTAVQQRIRWHLHELCPELDVPKRSLDRKPWPSRIARKLRELGTNVHTSIVAEQLKRMNKLTAEIDGLERTIAKLVRELAPELLAIRGCGTLTAAKILGEVAGVRRFRSAAKLALHAGVAPLPVSSGGRERHRLNRTGNRQLNAALHRIAITQAARDPRARAFIERKKQEGKSTREALRCLKRHLARVVFNALQQVEVRRSEEVATIAS